MVTELCPCVGGAELCRPRTVLLPESVRTVGTLARVILCDPPHASFELRGGGMLWVTKLCGDGGWYVRAWQTEFQDPQNPPKHLARAVSNEKRPENGGEKGRPGGAASFKSNGGLATSQDL